MGVLRTCRSPTEIVKMIGFGLQNYEYDVFMLIVQVVLVKCLAYVVLRARLKRGF